MGPVSVRFRVDLGEACAVGPGKVALLEGIRRTGSLSQAARELGMSYRRAWLLLESVNTAFSTPLATLTTGGRGGGGAVLTPFGEQLVSVYRAFEADLSARAADAFAPFADVVHAEAVAEVSRRPLSRHEPPGAARRHRRSAG